MILIIDNYDSFVHNVARYFRELGQAVEVVRNDAISVTGIADRQPQAVVFSPGPCTPQESGVCLELLRQRFHDPAALPTPLQELPLLGICLGHQTIAEAAGGHVLRAKEPVHGRWDWVLHANGRVFDGIPNPFRAGRYHSLVVEPATLPRELRVTAWTGDGNIMALEHVTQPIFGVQFHPESILTQYGRHLLRNFLCLTGVPHRDLPDPSTLPIEEAPAGGEDDFFHRPTVFPPV